MSLSAGIEFVRRKGSRNLYHAESLLCNALIRRLSAISDAVIYRHPRADYVPIVSFKIRGIPSEETAALLAKQGFCLRAGMHCAPLAHHVLGTEEGTVRFAPSVFSRMQDVQRLADAVDAIAGKNRQHGKKLL